jgi:hypothetical protein
VGQGLCARERLTKYRLLVADGYKGKEKDIDVARSRQQGRQSNDVVVGRETKAERVTL